MLVPSPETRRWTMTRTKQAAIRARSEMMAIANAIEARYPDSLAVVDSQDAVRFRAVEDGPCYLLTRKLSRSWKVIPILVGGGYGEPVSTGIPSSVPDPNTIAVAVVRAMETAE
jgi:hypothetical protein